MNFGTAAQFVGAYILITLLLANVLLFTPWSWWVKIGSCVLVGALFYLSYLSVPPLLGWPTAAALPSSFNLVGLHVVEPEKGSSDKGSIYIWVTDKMSDSPEDVPRAYRLPYSPALQSRLVEAGARLRKGVPQLGKINETAPLLTGAGHESVPNLEFFDEPEPLFPEK